MPLRLRRGHARRTNGFDVRRRAGSPFDVTENAATESGEGRTELAAPPRAGAVASPSTRPPAASEPSIARPRGLIAPPLPETAGLAGRFGRGLVRLGQGLYYHDAFQAAPAMAFHFFLSLLPLLVFVGYVIGEVVRARGADKVLWPVLDTLPSGAREVVAQEAERLGSATTLGPLAALGFLWLASGGVHGLMDALEIVVGAKRRPFLKKRLIALAWVIGTLGALVVVSFGVIEWDDAIHTAESVEQAPVGSSASQVGDVPLGSRPIATATETAQRTASFARRRSLTILRSGGDRALALAVSTGAAIFGLAAFYRLSVSHSRRVKRRVFPGALLAVALWTVISWGFGLYARTLASYALYYGSLAAVAVLLLWFWLTSLAILVGAELNSQLEGLRD